jgi:hypothetical protein
MFGAGFVVAFLGSIAILLVGLWLALSRGGTEIGTLGWIFVAFGAVFVAVNVVALRRMR